MQKHRTTPRTKAVPSKPFWRRRDRRSRWKLNLATLPVCLLLVAAGYLDPGAPALPAGYVEDLTRRLLDFGHLIERRKRRLRLSNECCARLVQVFLAHELEELKRSLG